jgi:hypothetical protein
MKLKFYTIYIILTILVYSGAISQDKIPEGRDQGAIKSGTFLPEHKKKEIKNKKMGFNVPRSSGMEKYYDSPGGCFRIHYDISNSGEFKNAVELIDRNSNGVPDYVDSVAYYADLAYDYYVEQLGYFSPCPDNGDGGSDRYDIYLVDMGNDKASNTFYGMTFQDGIILPNRKFERYYSYLLIDNDFSPLDSTIINDGKKVQTYKFFGTEAMKVTTVHELHHAIQYKYGNSIPSVALFNELTSTYYEVEIFPETPDYLQYVRSLFRSFEDKPFGNGNYEYGYGWSIFGQYMYKKYDPLLLKRVWELIYDGIPTYSALDSAFKELGTDLATAWYEFMPWLYYTGDRARDKDYFDDAAIFPMMDFYREDTFSKPSFTDTKALSPFEVRCFRCYFPSGEDFATDDTLDFIMTNTDLQSAVIQNYRKTEYTFIIADSQLPDMLRIANSDYYYSLESEKPTFCHTYFFNSGVSTNSLSTAFPNPFRFGSDDAIFFPAPDNAEIYDKVDVHIYSTDMMEIKSITLPVSVRNSYRVLRWDDISDEFSSGIYIYNVRYKGKDELGKFAILR